jgi:hypothetical protein
MGITPGNQQQFMTRIFLVYKISKGYAEHTKVLLGAATDINQILYICIKQAAKEEWTLPNTQIAHIEDKKCTYGYQGSGEFIYEQIQLNTLLKSKIEN